MLRTTGGHAGAARRRRWTAKSSCGCATWCWRCRWPERGRPCRPPCAASRPEDPRSGKFIADYVAWGAGPRGSQNLVLAAKARALLLGRTAPTADDVRALALPILRHRVIVNHRAVGDSITSAHIVDHLLKEVAA